MRRVTLPMQVFHAVARWHQPEAKDQGQEPWVPLILVPQWAQAHPEPAPTQTGPQLLSRLLKVMQADKASA